MPDLTPEDREGGGENIVLWLLAFVVVIYAVALW
jgi:hypothetical protein